MRNAHFGVRIDPDSRKGRFLSVLWFALGVLLLILAVFLFLKKNEKLRELPTAEALVLAVEHNKYESYTVVEYEVDGTAYIHTFDSYSIFRREGRRITVAYEPEDPEQIFEVGFMGYFASILAAFGGLVLLLISGGPRRVFRILGDRKRETEDNPAPWER